MQEQHIVFWWEKRMERDHLENVEKMGGQYEIGLKEILWNGADCTHEAQDMKKRIKTLKIL